MQLPQEQFGTISGVQLRVRRDTGPRLRRVTPQPPRRPGQGAGATPSAPALGFRTVPCGHDAGPVGDRAARFLEMQEQEARLLLTNELWNDGPLREATRLLHHNPSGTPRFREWNPLARTWFKT